MPVKKTIDCECLRRVGVEGHTSKGGMEGMADAGEVVPLPPDVAKKLQDAGAVKVAIPGTTEETAA